MAKTNSEKGIKIANEFTEELLKKMGFEAKVKTAEEDSALHIKIEGDDLGLLIGYHGESLVAIQLILALMINNNLDTKDWIPVNLDVGGWRNERSESLKIMIDKAAAEIEAKKELVELPPMSASQRRMVHVLLSDYPNITSESIGEEPNRKVVIKKA